ncbi:MAG: DNA repair photolyase [Microbacterium sp. SCN 70-27]|uniref:Rv2578c family radical SAM protein n=1 Tax=unclassified Microbacterium TaxID=2609290 RepID=UPI00086CAB66|nr:MULTISPECIES: Rv2578c family radical SAM protein [unclassified Microbacterium]MBN9223756.1 Rv2578c family radical SAM protein [Microbacterium sp.]ODT28856.1 MAG: DNA repair photolyase [Microbacterium sp. SCN 70-27]
MRWQGQSIEETDASALPGLESIEGLVRTVRTPDFQGITFHEVHAKSALNRVPAMSAMPFAWTVNPYRGCSHACAYCFARNTHTYLDLDAGRDFDSQIVVKTNVAEVLRRELAKPTWAHEGVALGTNTDPYQRAEGRYRLMPGIIEALETSGTPFSILTKGTLLRRDLPQLAAARVPISIAMSIAVFDDALQQSLEPGTPTTAARLSTVRAATDAGFTVTVFLMPILPHLTDSVGVLDGALAEIRAAGATRVVFGALHLRPGAKEWFWEWLEREHPELVPAYRGLYPGASAYAPQGYRKWLAGRVRPLLRRHRLAGGAETDAESADAWRRPARKGVAGDGAGARATAPPAARLF